jgi:phosphatidylglycerophosphate synthase
MVTCRLVLAGVLVLIPFVLFARQIAKVGLRTWLRESAKQTGFGWLGSYFPRGLKTVGPLIYLLLIFLCLYKLRPLGR